jgi:hypothetical protein
VLRVCSVFVLSLPILAGLWLAWVRMPESSDPWLSGLIGRTADRPCSEVEVVGLRGHNDPLEEWEGAGADVQALTAVLRQRLQGQHSAELFGFPYRQARDTFGLPLRVGRNVPPSAQLLRDYIERRSRQCPTTRLVVVGQSEGAAIAHWAYPEIESRITAMVLLGDPLHDPRANYAVDLGNRHHGQLTISLALDPLRFRFKDRIPAGAARVRSFCLPHDQVCGLNPFDREPSAHIRYRENSPGPDHLGLLDRAAEFIVRSITGSN